jgi:hypothetical protein
MKGTFQSASNLLYSLLVTMKILTTPPKEMKTKRQYSKLHPPFPSPKKTIEKKIKLQWCYQ